MRIILIGLLAVISSVAFGQVPIFPCRAVNSKDRIPPFFVLHRQYIPKGRSYYVPMRVDKKGILKKAPKKPYGRQEPVTIGSEYVFPSPGWKVRFAGLSTGGESPQDPLRVVYRMGSQDSEKNLPIPNWDLTFGPRAFYYDITRNQFYFKVTEGPTGYRRLILLRLDLSDSTLKEIGETWSEPILSSDHKWILWFPGDFVEIGGKHVYPNRMSIFSIEKQESLVITEGVVDDKFCGWDVDKTNQ
jgi:hypothetical protein